MERPFVVVVGAGASGAAHLIDAAAAGLTGRVHIARAAARREAPLTLEMLLERSFDREPGSLQGIVEGHAFETLIRNAGATVRRVLVIDEAEYVPADVLRRLTLLSTLLGSTLPPLKVVLLGTSGLPAVRRQIDKDDVVDLDKFPDLSPISAKSLPVARAGSTRSTRFTPPVRPYLSAVMLGLVVLVGSVLGTVQLAGRERTRFIHDRFPIAFLDGKAAPLSSDQASVPHEQLETPSNPGGWAPQAKHIEVRAVPAAPTFSSELPGSSQAPRAPAASPTARPQAHPAPDPTAVPLEPALSAAVLEAIMRRGYAAFAEGDVVAARLLFERGASSSAAAALAAGKTFDPNFLGQKGTRTIQPDREAAAFWYGAAKAKGDPQAAGLLERLLALPPGSGNPSTRASQP